MLTGTNSLNKYVDVIHYGDINIGIRCTNKELLEFCKNQKSLYINTSHFSIFSYQNWCKNISFSKKSEPHRNYIQIKCFSILSDINKIRKTNDVK